MSAIIPHLDTFRYLDSLDSIRYSKKIDFYEIRTLHAKAEMLIAFIFGDGVIVPENQFVDSKGFLNIVSKLIPSSKKRGFIPIRVALRDMTGGVNKAAASLFSKIDENIIKARFVLSSYHRLDEEPRRRKKWAEYIEKGERIPKDIIRRDEEEIYDELKTVLDYFSSPFYGEFSVVKSKNIPIVFAEEMSQIGFLSERNLDSLFMEQADPVYKHITHPAWLRENQASEAKAIVTAIGKLHEDFGDKNDNKKIKARSIVHTHISDVTDDLELQKGVLEVVDTFYNYNVGVSVGADYLSDTTLRDVKNKYVQVANSLATWARETVILPTGIVHSNPYGWFGETEFRFEKVLNKTENQKTLKQIPLDSCLDMWEEPNWQDSIAEYRFRRDELQAINKGIATSNKYDVWAERHNDAKKHLRDAWDAHIEFCSSYLTAVHWKKSSEALSDTVVELMNKYEIRFTPGLVEFNGRMLADMINRATAPLKIIKRNEIKGLISDLAEASKSYKGE